MIIIGVNDLCWSLVLIEMHLNQYMKMCLTTNFLMEKTPFCGKTTSLSCRDQIPLVSDANFERFGHLSKIQSKYGQK
jgi:hypothetical protein